MKRIQLDSLTSSFSSVQLAQEKMYTLLSQNFFTESCADELFLVFAPHATYNTCAKEVLQYINL